MSLLDLTPTIIDLAGLPPRDHFVGRSLFAPGSDASPPTAVGEIVGAPGAGARAWFARQGRWKIIVDADGGIRLFDLVVDPTETRDVAAEHPEESGYLATLATARPELPAAAIAPVDDASSPEERRKRDEALRALGYVE